MESPTRPTGVPPTEQDRPPAERPPTLEKIFEEYAPRVYHLARRLLGNTADAEELTQDVFVQVLRKLPTFRGEAAFSTWLYRVAVNAALSLRRKRASHQTAPLPEELDQFGEDGRHRAPVRRWAAGPGQQVLDRETSQRIEEAVAGLPEIYRDVFVLGDVDGLPNAEVASLLGLNVPVVKTRLHRARMLMRRALAPYFEEKVA